MIRLRNTYTAIVTPFSNDGHVDFGKLRELIDKQHEAGISGIVPVGTTGESPSLDFSEHIEVIRTTVEACAGKMQVIAGSGANSTSEAMELTRQALALGADASLQVTPYYNKPNQEGLYRHFSAIADLGLPVVLYNVPGRSSREIDITTITRLAAHPNIIAVKEAGGSVDRVSRILAECSITVLSGDDALALPMISVGAEGVISVASNIIPARVVTMIQAALDGDMRSARTMHRELYPLFRDLFIDTNPIPVKAAMMMAGIISGNYRLPLCETTEKNLNQLRHTLASLNITECA